MVKFRYHVLYTLAALMAVLGLRASQAPQVIEAPGSQVALYKRKSDEKLNAAIAKGTTGKLVDRKTCDLIADYMGYKWIFTRKVTLPPHNDNDDSRPRKICALSHDKTAVLYTYHVLIIHNETGEILKEFDMRLHKLSNIYRISEDECCVSSDPHAIERDESGKIIAAGNNISHPHFLALYEHTVSSAKTIKLLNVQTNEIHKIPTTKLSQWAQDTHCISCNQFIIYRTTQDDFDTIMIYNKQRHKQSIFLESSMNKITCLAKMSDKNFVVCLADGSITEYTFENNDTERPKAIRTWNPGKGPIYNVIQLVDKNNDLQKVYIINKYQSLKASPTEYTQDCAAVTMLDIHDINGERISISPMLHGSRGQDMSIIEYAASQRDGELILLVKDLVPNDNLHHSHLVTYSKCVDYEYDNQNSWQQYNKYAQRILASASCGLGLLSAYHWYKGTSLGKVGLTTVSSVLTGLAAVKLYRSR
jgi:hypothetical protein